MNSIGAMIFLIAAGPGFLWMGIASLRRGYWRESVPLLEVVIDRAAGIEPPPRNKWDRRFALFQAWMFVIIGAVFSLFLVVVLISFVSE